MCISYCNCGIILPAITQNSDEQTINPAVIHLVTKDNAVMHQNGALDLAAVITNDKPAADGNTDDLAGAEQRAYAFRNIILPAQQSGGHIHFTYRG
jgi:hypothetical protein